MRENPLYFWGNSAGWLELRRKDNGFVDLIIGAKKLEIPVATFIGAPDLCSSEESAKRFCRHLNEMLKKEKHEP